MQLGPRRVVDGREANDPQERGTENALAAEEDRPAAGRFPLRHRGVRWRGREEQPCFRATQRTQSAHSNRSRRAIPEDDGGASPANREKLCGPCPQGCRNRARVGIAPGMIPIRGGVRAHRGLGDWVPFCQHRDWLDSGLPRAAARLGPPLSASAQAPPWSPRCATSGPNALAIRATLDLEIIASKTPIRPSHSSGTYARSGFRSAWTFAMGNGLQWCPVMSHNRGSRRDGAVQSKGEEK